MGGRVTVGGGQVAWASNEMGEMLHSAKAARRKKRRQQQQQPKGDSAGAGKSRAESEEEEDQQDLDEGMRAAECFQRAVLVSHPASRCLLHTQQAR